jgi:hypothetical protein
MNPRDNEREFGAMVRRGLASGPAAPESEHLDAEVLAAYFERTLTAEEIRACDLHVSNCAHCRSELAALARAEPEREGSGSRRFTWIWDWRFLVPVTAALALFIAWATVWAPFGPRNGRVATPIVAQNQAPAETAPQVPPPVPPSTEMVEVSPAPPSAATKDSKGGAAVHGKNVESTNARNGQPTDEESRNTRREFKKERDRGANDTTAGGSGAGAGSATGGSAAAGGNPASAERPGAAAPAAPAATSAPNGSNETVGVYAGEVAVNPAPASPGGAPAAKANATNGAAPAQNSTAARGAPASPKVPAARPAGGTRGAAVADTAGGIAAQKSAAPPEAETVTSRFKEDESTPIVIPTPDANILWRVAGAHEIELSRDIGATWQAQLTETDVRLVTGFAPSSKICWVVGRHGTILRTVDGENWQAVKSPTEVDLTAVRAEDAEVATITAADGTAYVTKNGGAKWKRLKKSH